jgi:hypothetical protein
MEGDLTMARVNIGIVGAGKMGRAFAAQLAAAEPASRPHGSPSPERLQSSNVPGNQRLE